MKSQKKNKCKTIKKDHKRCKEEAVILGYCIRHFWSKHHKKPEIKNQGTIYETKKTKNIDD